MGSFVLQESVSISDSLKLILMLIDYAEKNQITVTKDKMGEPPFSTDANLLHTSSEGKLLEDPWLAPPEYIFSRINLLKTLQIKERL